MSWTDGCRFCSYDIENISRIYDMTADIETEYTVKIEKMLYGGAGLAHINSLPVFVRNSAPEDIVKIKISKTNKNFMEGVITSFEKPSKYRIKPSCPFASSCGSCDWLHISYDEQLKQKKIIIEETFKKTAGMDIKIDEIIPSPKISEYRCKVQLPYAQTKVSKRLLSGYYKKHSHELINIKYCPAHPAVINEINEFLKEKAAALGISGYSEKLHTGLIRHVIYRISSDLNQILIIIVVNSNVIDKRLKKLSELLMNKYPKITGICADFNTKKTNVIISGAQAVIAGKNYYTETLCAKRFKIPSSGFFQVNPYCAELLFQKVKKLILERIEKPYILDAYSGVSSFGICLSSIASGAASIEESKTASAYAEENIKINRAENVKAVCGDAAEEFEKLLKKGVKFDVSITDPPRKGCSAEAAEYLAKLTSKYIIYVSCNPSSLARDVKLLNEKGFELEYISAADMFPNTCSIETIAVLKKSAGAES